MSDVNELSELTGEFRNISETLRKLVQEKQGNNNINVNTSGLRDSIYSGVVVGVTIFAIVATVAGVLAYANLSAKLDAALIAAGDREVSWVATWTKRVEDAKSEIKKANEERK